MHASQKAAIIVLCTISTIGLFGVPICYQNS